MDRLPTLLSRGPDETHGFGVALGRCLMPGHVVGLVGGLGAGKTTLAGGVAEGMDVPPETYVSSPTFTLVNEYDGRFPLIHIDFYRLSDPEDLVEIGLDDYYGGPVACLVEWFDRFADALPSGYLQVTLEVTGPEERRFELRAVGVSHAQLARQWADRAQ